MAAKNKSDGWHELNHLVIFQNDNYGYKARPQMLAEKKQRTNVWKQIGAQVIGIGFNLVQAYFLQYLPARHRDRADERMMPRGPLF